MTSQPECTISALSDEVLILITDLMTNTYSWERTLDRINAIVVLLFHIDMHINAGDMTQEEGITLHEVVIPRWEECSILMRNIVRFIPQPQWN